MSANRWSKLSRQQRGYDAAWDRLRLVVMQRDRYCCQVCWNKTPPRFTPAAAVDHLIPKAKGGTNALENLRAICRACHLVKTLQDSGKKPRERIGADGYPIEER
jgi:5-methylcytosine-specific restriction protein A